MASSPSVLPDPAATSLRMRAVLQPSYGPVESLRVTDVSRPRPGAGEVLVRVRAAGVDPSVWHLAAGHPYLVRLMGFGLRRPKRPIVGTDLAGIVEAVGAEVDGLHVGDEVMGAAAGAFAEYAVLRADRCVPKPSDLPFAEAAVIPVSGATALQALRDVGHVGKGDRVLILGAGGGVGTYAVQLAVHLGAEVTAVCSTSKLELVRALGADQTIDYTRDDPLATSPPYDVIVDIAGNRPVARLRRALSPTGTLVIVGGEGGGRWFGGLQRQLKGALLTPFIRQRLATFMATTRAEDLRELLRLVEAGTLRPILDRTFPLEEAPAALRYVQDGRAAGKVALTL